MIPNQDTCARAGLVREIEIAWLEAQPPSPANISQPTYDDEGVSTYFTGQIWRGHSAKQLRSLSFAPGVLTHDAFAYFLPAYMIADIEDPETADTIVEALLFHLSGSLLDAERGVTIVGLLNAAQKRALARYIRFVDAREDGLYEQECARILTYLSP